MFTKDVLTERAYPTVSGMAMAFNIMAVDFVLLSFTGYPIGRLPEDDQTMPGIFWMGGLLLVLGVSIYFMTVAWPAHLDKK